MTGVSVAELVWRRTGPDRGEAQAGPVAYLLTRLRVGHPGSMLDAAIGARFIVEEAAQGRRLRRRVHGSPQAAMADAAEWARDNSSTQGAGI
jgi:hypothetical protein